MTFIASSADWLCIVRCQTDEYLPNHLWVEILAIEVDNRSGRNISILCSSLVGLLEHLLLIISESRLIHWNTLKFSIWTPTKPQFNRTSCGLASWEGLVPWSPVSLSTRVFTTFTQAFNRVLERLDKIRSTFILIGIWDLWVCANYLWLCETIEKRYVRRLMPTYTLWISIRGRIKKFVRFGE